MKESNNEDTSAYLDMSRKTNVEKWMDNRFYQIQELVKILSDNEKYLMEPEMKTIAEKFNVFINKFKEINTSHSAIVASFRLSKLCDELLSELSQFSVLGKRKI